MHDSAKSVVYKIVLTGDKKLLKTVKEIVAEDDRQAAKNVDEAANTFELHVTARRKPDAAGKDEQVSDDYLKSNFFIASDDETVKKLAAKAVGTATDPWDKARKIEKWVKQNMKVMNFSEAMASADHVAKTLSGDCTEYAMLAAAMCRAEGVPSRTAIGLVYVDKMVGAAKGDPALAFHMWTEVFVKGKWLAIDATLGHGSVGPGHVKISDQSWAGEVGFKPLLPTLSFLQAKPKVEIVSASDE